MNKLTKTGVKSSTAIQNMNVQQVQTKTVLSSCFTNTECEKNPFYTVCEGTAKRNPCEMSVLM